MHDVITKSLDKKCLDTQLTSDDYRNVSCLSLHNLYSTNEDTENVFDCPRMMWYTKFHESKSD